MKTLLTNMIMPHKDENRLYVELIYWKDNSDTWSMNMKAVSNKNMRSLPSCPLPCTNTVEPLIADTPVKRTPNSGPNRFFYKILVI